MTSGSLPRTCECVWAIDNAPEGRRSESWRRLRFISRNLSLLLSKLKEISFSWHSTSSSLLLSPRCALFPAPAYKIGLTSLGPRRWYKRYSWGQFDLWFFAFFFLHFVFSFCLSASAHQAKWKCRYSEVVVDTEITLRQKFLFVALLRSCCYSPSMELKNLKSVFLIAEIGQNHQGDIRVAKDVIKLPPPKALI